MWEVAGSMVVHHIQNYGDTFLMASIDKVLVIFLGTVCLIHGKEVARVVAPTVVAVEFLGRHQFNRVDSHLFQIAKLGLGTMDIAGSCEVTEQKFVNNQLLRFCQTEITPSIGVFLCLEYRNDAFSLGWVSKVVGICRCRDVLVIVRIENLFAIRVADADGFATFSTYIILEGIFLIGVQSANGRPPASGSIVAVHLTAFVVGQCPVVEVTENVCIVLALAVFVFVIKNESHGRCIDYVDTLLYTCRQGCFLYGSRFETLVLGVGNGDERIFIDSFLVSVSTTDDDTQLVDRSFARIEPLADAWRKSDAPCIVFFGLAHLALGDVLVPVGWYMLPVAIAYHTDMYIDFARISVQGRLAIGLES